MRIITLVAGSLLLLLGLVSMVSPIPGGTLLIAAGIAMLICSSRRAAALVKRSRRRYVRLNKAMIWLEDHMGEKISAPLRQTRP